jgi:hypothetical protein
MDENLVLWMMVDNMDEIDKLTKLYGWNLAMYTRIIKHEQHTQNMSQHNDEWRLWCGWIDKRSLKHD